VSYNVKCSFPPVIDSSSRVLILGSLPGEESLRRQQYYANPRNGFWLMLGAVFDEPVGKTYEERLAFILRHHLALWDTVECADREGSLDAKIVHAKANDFPALFAQHPALRAVAFNGGKSEELFNRLALPKLPADLTQRLKFVSLPSTSPANVQPIAKKMGRWRTLLDLLD
jgi:double-stranded uracil-DNA glycosylase